MRLGLGRIELVHAEQALDIQPPSLHFPRVISVSQLTLTCPQREVGPPQSPGRSVSYNPVAASFPECEAEEEKLSDNLKL